jgi:hypothetical protein
MCSKDRAGYCKEQQSSCQPNSCMVSSRELAGIYSHDYRRVCAFVDRNNIQAATIVVATTVNTVCVFQPACTNAVRRLYLVKVLI